jgi:hypothetical protein
MSVAVPYMLKPKATSLPAGHDKTLDPPFDPVDALIRGVPASQWPRVDTSRGGTGPADPALAPPGISPTRRTLAPSIWPTGASTPNRALRETLSPMPFLDPDIELWPQIKVNIWPFTGAPTTGIWPKGWVGVDNTATMYICVTGGDPGAWQQVGGLGPAIVAPFPTGVATVDTAALAASLTSAIANGVPLLLGPGTYLTNAQLATPSQSTGYLVVRGCGKYATTILATAAMSSVFDQQMPGSIEDLTIDGGGVATNGLAQITSGTVSITEMAARRCRMRNTLNGGGGWVHIVWDQAGLYQIDRFYLEDCNWEGPADTAHDAAAVSYVNMCFVNNLRVLNCPRTPNFYQMRYLVLDGALVTGTTGTSGGLVIDGGVQIAYVRGLVHPDTIYGTQAIFNGPTLSVEQSEFGQPPQLNIGALTTPTYRFEECDFTNGAAVVSNPVGALQIKGGTITIPSGGSVAAIADECPASSTSLGLEVEGVTINCSSNPKLLFSFNGTNWGGPGFSNCQLIAGSSASITGVTAANYGFGIHNCPGFNPVGPVTVAVPAASTPVATAFYDRIFYVTASASGAAGISLAGASALTVPTSGTFSVFCPASVPLAWTGSHAPTWTVWGT